MTDRHNHFFPPCDQRSERAPTDEEFCRNFGHDWFLQFFDAESVRCGVCEQRLEVSLSPHAYVPPNAGGEQIAKTDA